jgi:methyl-accepting chemotaxis protein
MSEGMNRPRLSLGLKLYGLAAVLSTLMVVVVVVALSSLGKVADDGHRGYAKSTVALDELSDARGLLNFNRALFFKYLLEPKGDVRATLAQTIATNDTAIDRALSRFSSTLVVARGRALNAQLVNDMAEYRAQRVRNFTIVDGGRPAAAYDFANVRVTPIGNRITTAFAQLQRLKLQQAAAADASARDRYRSARTTVLGLLALALVLGGAMATLITRGVRRNVRQILSRLTSLSEHDTRSLQAGLGRVAEGDLTVDVTPQTTPIASWSEDELGDVARAVNTVRENTAASMDAYNVTRDALSSMIGQVAGTAGTVSSASQQMASTSEEAGRAVGEIASAIGEVAEGSQRQVMGIDDARRLTDGVVEATGRSAQDAARTAQVADEARDIAREGAEAVSQATEAMASVRSASAEATNAIRQLGDKSQEIGGIVDTIGGIAEQTNLLALNAAIEAARAGDQGRGFAVVADEVRKLAEESQQAAASISSLIREIQAETGRAVTVVEDGAARTAQGAATVERARDAFERIGGSVDDVTARISQIAAGVQEIAASSAETGRRISEIAAVAEQSSASAQEVSASTEQTSASTQQIAASAQELARSAGDLEALVGQFTLR